jgi:hypothetical protein
MIGVVLSSLAVPTVDLARVRLATTSLAVSLAESES